MTEQKQLMDSEIVQDSRMRALMYQVKLLNQRVWELEKKVGSFSLVKEEGSLSTPPGNKKMIPSQTKLNNKEDE